MADYERLKRIYKEDPDAALLLLKEAKRRDDDHTLRAALLAGLLMHKDVRIIPSAYEFVSSMAYDSDSYALALKCTAIRQMLDMSEHAPKDLALQAMWAAYRNAEDYVYGGDRVLTMFDYRTWKRRFLRWVYDFARVNGDPHLAVSALKQRVNNETRSAQILAYGFRHNQPSDPGTREYVMAATLLVYPRHSESAVLHCVRRISSRYNPDLAVANAKRFIETRCDGSHLQVEDGELCWGTDVKVTLPAFEAPLDDAPWAHFRYRVQS